MAKLLKLRRGTTSQHSSFTGAEGEVTVDTTKDTIVVHDGSTAGGVPLAKESAALSLIDEDNMSTNSATRPPSQQSVKAYVDTADALKANLANPTFTGTVNAAALTLSGNLQVNGTTTTVASSTMTVTDKNIEIAKGAANDAAADGAGITIDSGDGDKTWNWVDATDAWTSSEHIHVVDNKKLIVGTGSDLQIYHDTSNGSYIREAGFGDLVLQGSGMIRLQGSAAGETLANFSENGAVELYHDNSKKIETTAAGVTVTGTVTDSKGDVRSIPQLNKSASYTLIASDAGKHITTNSGITVNPNVLSVGDAVTIINASGSDITITQGSSQTIYNTADASTGNRTLAARGMATMLFTSAATAYISGAGLS